MAITSLRLVHATSDEKVETVKAEMLVLGPPKIRVVDCGDCYMAIEGCHRLMAAAELGIVPDLQVLAPDDLVEVDSLETDFFPPGATYTARKVAREYRGPRNPVLIINPDGTLAVDTSDESDE
jgi:hypothetical protein